MRKSIFISFLILVSSLFAFAQQQKVTTPQFTKAELLKFADVKAMLSAVNGRDYSNFLVRNFTLSTVPQRADSTKTKVSETGPGGEWSERQKSMIEKYANKGVSFTLENILLLERGKKGLVDQPTVTFFIK